jgi:hypothetical protein
MKIVRLAIFGALLALVLALPAAAGAEDLYPLTPPPTVQGADVMAPAPTVLPKTQAPAVAATAPTGTLPFTGADVVGLAALGAGLLVVGVVLTRRGRDADPTS